MNRPAVAIGFAVAGAAAFASGMLAVILVLDALVKRSVRL